MTNKVVVWDSDKESQNGDFRLVYWCELACVNSSNAISISDLVEKDADNLRIRYLSWVYEIGELDVNGCRLVDALQIRNGLSFWWLTLLTEKCNFAKSTQIDDVIKFLAFIDWAKAINCRNITLYSANRQLATSLGEWSKQNGIEFKWKRSHSLRFRIINWKFVYSYLPNTILGIIWIIKYVVQRWPLKGVGLKQWRRSAGRLTFVSYLTNLTPEALKFKKFESNYWGTLPELLEENSQKSNWLHLYVNNSNVGSPAAAARFINSLNEGSYNSECHVTLDSFIGFNTLFSAIKDWIKLLRISRSIERKIDRKLSEEGCYIWPFFVNDWRKSTIGHVAIGNLFFLNLFESAFRNITRQRDGVYLQENQAWEFGLIHAWRACGHARINGFPHSTVRFWDLRYFYDSRTYLNIKNNKLPMPDLIACNGNVTRKMFVEGGYPHENLFDVEALRYLHLGSRTNVNRAINANGEKRINLLVLGDFLESKTNHVMAFLVKASKFVNAKTNLIVKAHPSCPILPSKFSELKFKISTKPIGELLNECDIALTSSMTSAAVDAYCHGIPVVSVMDGKTLNLSPLRGFPGVQFISRHHELISALLTFEKSTHKCDNERVLFNIDRRLIGWKRLLIDNENTCN